MILSALFMILSALYDASEKLSEFSSIAAVAAFFYLIIGSTIYLSKFIIKIAKLIWSTSS